MLRTLVALAGLVLLAGCMDPAYTAPAYVAPLPYSQIDPSPFLRQSQPQAPRNVTCYPVGMYTNCSAY